MQQSAAPQRIVYFRVVDPDYPRNRRIRAALGARGHQVTVVPPVQTGPRVVRHLRDLVRLARSTRRGDVIVVAEQYLRSVPVAAAVARAFGCRLVVDAFVGIHETAVDDWKVARPGSLRARRFRLQDRFAVRAADCVLIDTDVRAAGLRRRHPRSGPVITLPVGAPSWAVPTDRTDDGGSFRVLYYGNYVPLHGLDVVLRAVAATRQPITLTMLGDGASRPEYEQLAADLGLGGRVVFVPPVPERELASVIARHDVVLGVFGSSDKARTVIANKTWQGLASDRVVITMASPALAELRPLVGPARLVEVDVRASGTAALTSALDALATAPDRQHDDRVAERLEQYTQERFRVFLDWIEQGAGAR